MTRAHFDDEIAQGHNIDIHTITIYTSKCSKIQIDEETCTKLRQSVFKWKSFSFEKEM